MILDLMKEKQNDFQMKLIIYQTKMERHFNPKVCTKKKTLKIGDLVLKIVFVAKKKKASISQVKNIPSLTSGCNTIGVKYFGEQEGNEALLSSVSDC